LNSSIVLFQSGKEDAFELENALAAKDVEVHRCRSLPEVHTVCHQTQSSVIVLDLDDAYITNQAIRDLKMKHPLVHLIAISSRPFHPELKESLRSYLYACASKPVDVEELMYLVTSIFRDLSRE
jgi:DNA-binding NtrC family response regulator